MIKLSMQTILKNLVETTIKEWKIRVPDKKLEDYDNWSIDLINKIDYQLKKNGIDMSETIVDTIEKEKPTEPKKEEL